MAILNLNIYKTTVSNGTVVANSTLTTLAVDDTNDDGVIDALEWQSYADASHYLIVGESSPQGLWDGSGGSAGSNSSGYLYTATPYAAGDDVSTLLSTLGQAEFQPAIADMNVCYLAGTLIATPSGEVPVESLRAGDVVMTRDNGPQPLVWTGTSIVTPEALDLAPNQRPLRVKTGALGGGVPRRDVDLSPQHRILVTDEEGKEFLISARHLMMSGIPGISLRPLSEKFRLVHIACAQHQILLAEGAPMESFFTGRMAIRALTQVERLGLMMVFPELGMGQNPMTPARPFIRHRDYARMQASAPQT